jgi:hypothetical protein
MHACQKQAYRSEHEMKKLAIVVSFSSYVYSYCILIVNLFCLQTLKSQLEILSHKQINARNERYL